MTTYATGNPIGSVDARDLYDNAENLDTATNSTAHGWTDRLGVERVTYSGMEDDFQAFLLASGYVDLGEYESDMVITARNQIFTHGGEYYRAAAATVLPYTTTGSWSEDSPDFVAIGDAALRQDLALHADTTIGFYRNAVNCNQYGGLALAVADADTAGKTIVVTDAQEISAPLSLVGRNLVVEYGGKITYSGSGSLTGLKYTKPEWFGAVSGTSRSAGERTANTTAINRAFAAIIGSGSLILSDGPYEVSGAMLWGSTTAIFPAKTSVVGLRDDNSKIISFSTINVVDAVGLEGLNISGVRFYSTSAAIGLLTARTSSGAANGAWLSMDHCRIDGAYSKAAFASIAVEIMRVSDCVFHNSAASAKVYASSGINTTLEATTTFGTIFGSSNTDIRFNHCAFWSAANGQSNVWLEDAFDGTFDGCLMIAEDSDTTNKLIHLVSNTGSIFNGKTSVKDSLLEGESLTAVYFDHVGAAGTFNHVDFQHNSINIFGTGNKIIDYDDPSVVNIVGFNWQNNKIGSLATDAFSLPVLVQNSIINAPSTDITCNGTVLFSEIVAASVTWASGVSEKSIVVTDDGEMAIGVGPSVTGLTPVSHTSEKARRLILGPVIDFFATPAPGEIQITEAGYGSGFPGNTTPGLCLAGFFDGEGWRQLGAYYGTPASATATGKAGQILYDTSYVYFCVTANTWKRVAIAGW